MKTYLLVKECPENRQGQEENQNPEKNLGVVHLVPVS
jgi:hypothetical protein